MKLSTILVVFILLGLNACVGKKPVASESNEVAAPKQDITKPPQTIGTRKKEVERNPEETISFEEWREKRLKELEEERNP